MVINSVKTLCDTLHTKSVKVDNSNEIQVIIRLLESVLQGTTHVSISAPEVGIGKQVAIVRKHNFSIDLVNPKIIKQSNYIVSHQETCVSLPEQKQNCLRYDKLVIENGMNCEQITITGENACMVQHEIDHLNGVLMTQRSIKLCVVRENNVFNTKKDLCVCGCGKKFNKCLKPKE
jgi:peptide deformylase